ncbi:reverse transcriptase domain-containing protein [Tanacetum coccineum]
MTERTMEKELLRGLHGRVQKKLLSTAQIPPPVIPIFIPESDVPTTLTKTTPIPESDISKSLPKTNYLISIRRDDQQVPLTKLRIKWRNSPIFQNLRFGHLFTDYALLLMQDLLLTIKSLLHGIKEKFAIGLYTSLWADLGASINLMPLFSWKKLSQPELTPTMMTLELADRSITYPKGLVEDVFVKVGKFHFPTALCVYFRSQSSSTFILGDPFLGQSGFIDVYGQKKYPSGLISKLSLLKKKLTEAPILVVPDWNIPFELMCDASDFAIGAVLGQRKMKHFQPIHYASKTMTEAQIHYTTTEKEMLAVVFLLKSFGHILSYPKA